MSENKTSKYFKYAIGEILLVVIGILIALQINNWNDQRKLERLAMQYYEQLLVDMENESENVASLQGFLEKSIASFERYKDTFKDSTNTSRDTYMALFGVEYTFPYIRFNTNTIKTLESTGDIKHLSPKVREALIDLDRKFENMASMTKANNSKYMDALLKAGELGLNNLAYKLQYQDDLKEQVEAEYNMAKMIITADGAYTLKNFTEMQLHKDLTDIGDDIAQIRNMIDTELK